MDDDFDEFGNYIGDEYSNSDIEVEATSQWDDVSDSSVNEEVKVDYHRYDTQGVEEPLAKAGVDNKNTDVTPVNWELHSGVLESAPGLVRNIVFIGDVNHGKTSILRLLLDSSVTDVTLDKHIDKIPDQQRGVDLSTHFMSILVENSRLKSYVFNIADTPGHPDFSGEVAAASSISDGVVQVIDVLEFSGQYRPPPSDSRILVFNKIDRLILEHRLPAKETYRRLKTIADELGVELEKVVFASAKFGFLFTLSSINTLYRKYRSGTDNTLNLSSESQFVAYVLDPIYKLMSCGLLGSKAEPALASLGIHLDPHEWDLEFENRTALIFAQYFEDSPSPLIDCVVEQIGSPLVVGHDSSLSTRDVINISHGGSVYSVGKVVTGTLNNYNHEIWVPLGSKKTPVSKVHCGSWYMKPCSLAVEMFPSERSVLKVGLEESVEARKRFAKPLSQGISSLSLLYPSLKYYPSENGVHYICAPGELYLDTFLRELKVSGFAFRSSNPFVELQESVSSESYVELPIESPQGAIAVIATPYKDALTDTEQIWHVANHNCYLLGPSPKTDFDDIVVNSIVEGFKWFTERGPLSESLVCNVVLRITQLRGYKSHAQQLSLSTHHSCNAAMLVASPILLEPWLSVSVVGGLAAGKACYAELGKRGGRVTKDLPILGTNLYVTEGMVPAMDSFGLQTDIQCQLEASNSSRVTLSFNGWEPVSGDPLDASLKVPRLKPADGATRARDFMYKLRKLRGLAPEPQLSKYLSGTVRQMVG